MTLEKSEELGIGENRSLLTVQDSTVYHNHGHGHSSSAERKSNRSGCVQSCSQQIRVLSCMLLCVVLKFLICHTLPAIIDLGETVMDEKQFQTVFMVNVVDTSTLLIVANSSLNIFIYAWCSGGFWRNVKDF